MPEPFLNAILLAIVGLILGVVELQAAAIHSQVDVYGSNERVVVEMQSKEFGTVMYCIIGASQVGSCNMIVKDCQSVQKVTLHHSEWLCSSAFNVYVSY